MSQTDTKPKATDDNSVDATAPSTTPKMGILAQYIRDLSFENPAAPNFPQKSPEISINANVGVRKLTETDYEVGLKFQVEAKEKAKTLFLVELEYCGIFRLENIPESESRPVLLIEAPRQLFPFARRVLADATRDGGYPPVLLDPIDFVALYRQAQQNNESPKTDTEPALN